MDRLIDEYRTAGFVIVRGFFAADQLAKITNEVERVVNDAAATPEPGRVYFDDEQARVQLDAAGVRCVFRIQEQSDYLRELLDSSQMSDMVRRFLDDDPIAGGIQYIDKPPHASYEFPYHQDNAYMFYQPPLALVATGALDQQFADSGSIGFLRGSHALQILPHQPSGVLGASRGLVEPPDLKTYPEVTVDMEPGDVLIHHANVIHRTGPNHTTRHRRNLGFVYHGASASIDKESLASYERDLARFQDSV